MRAIKIDSENRMISEVEIKDYKDMQSIVNGCICLAFDYPGEKNACYVDDEGILKNPEFFFAVPYYPQPFAGNGIIVGMGRYGDIKKCQLNIDDVRKEIKFFTLKEIQHMISRGSVDYNTYITTIEGTSILSKNDLGAFD